MSTHPLALRPPLRSSTRWTLIVTLAVLAALALWFIRSNALRYLAYDAATYQEYWPRRAGLIPHILGGLVAITTGLIQLWLGLTGHTGKVHRTLGKFYLAGVAVGSAGGFYMALTISDPSVPGYRWGLIFLSSAWVLTTSMAYLAVRRRAFEQHRDWMLRSYIVTFGFVTFRLADTLLERRAIHAAPDYYTMLAWGCWAVPLLLAEPWIQRRHVIAVRTP